MNAPSPQEVAARPRGEFVATMATPRDTDFLMLGVDYPHGLRTFIVAPGVTDEVSPSDSSAAGTGHEYKPRGCL